MIDYSNSTIINMFNNGTPIKEIIKRIQKKYGMKKDNAAEKVYALLIEYNNNLIKLEKKGVI